MLCLSNLHYFEILGVKPTATVKEIKTAYYSLSKKHHPDTNPDRKDEAAKMFTMVRKRRERGREDGEYLQVSEAYEILSSEDKRKAYDLTRRPGQSKHISLLSHISLE